MNPETTLGGVEGFSVINKISFLIDKNGDDFSFSLSQLAQYYCINAPDR
jgi:hypothetical protein